MDENLELMYEEGEKALKNGQNKDAYNIFKKITEIDPNHSKSHNKIGVILANVGQLDVAKEFFTKAIATDEKNASAKVNLGNIYFQNKAYDEAKSLYLEAYDMDKENPILLNNLATIYKKEGKIEDYLKYYKLSQKFLKENLKSEVKQDNFLKKRREAQKEKKGCLGQTLMICLIVIGALFSNIL